MNRTHKLVNLLGIGLPVLGLLAAVVLLWNRGVGVTALAILAVGYVLTGIGITVGYHRLFTHRAFETYPAIRYVVSPATLRPVRAEYRLPSGKVATIVEFAEWSGGGRPYARRLLVRDALHGGATTAVDVLEVEARPVPDGLFDLADPAARQRLEAAPLKPS